MHKYYIKKYQEPAGTIKKGANAMLTKIKGFTDQHSDFIKGGVQKLTGAAIDVSTDIENNLLGVQRDGVDDLANGAAKIATKFGPWGYCVCKGTRVITSSGQFKNIEDLKQEDGIVGWDNGYKIENISTMFHPTMKPCVEIETEKGFNLKCSFDHPILFSIPGRANRQTINGVRQRVKDYRFINAEFLKIGDIIGLLPELPIFGEKDIENSYLIGVLIGDGTYGKDSIVKLFSADKQTWDYIESNNLGKYIDQNRYKDRKKEFRTYHITNGCQLLKNVGIYGQTKESKRLPINIHEFNKQSLSELIAGLFDTDGCVHFNNKNSYISFVQSNLELIKELREQLLKFGIYGYISKRKQKISKFKDYESLSKECYALIIKDKKSIINFYNNIPIRLDYKKQNLEKLYNFKLKIHSKDNSDINNIVSDKIKSIKSIGEQLVYNIETSNSHTYIANFIITHNTAAAIIKGANFLSKGFGEKVGGFDGGTGSSGFQDYTMEGKQFRANPLNIFSAFTKSNSAKAYEAEVKRQAEQYAMAKNIVDEQDMQNKARNQRLQEENILTHQVLNGITDYSAILAKKGGKLNILKAQLGYKFIRKESPVEEVYEDQPERDIEIIELFEDDSIEYEKEYLQNENSKTKKEIEQFKNGGSIIPEGALHKNKHHIDDPKLEGQITEKGIPVITIEEDGGIIQHAEIETGEIILEISISKQIEKLWKEGTDEAAIEAGKILAKEICRNTTDKTGLIKQAKKDENNNKQ